MSNCDNNCSLIEYILSSDPICGGYELENCADNQTITDIVDEHLLIGASNINVFKLLGVHEQGKLLDVTGRGSALSGGDGHGYPADYAFNKLCGSWRSSQRGPAVLTHAFLGYDFGPIVDPQSQRTYHTIETFGNKHITTIRIRQGANAANRATRVRVERSRDGLAWVGAAVITLPNDAELHQIPLKGSAPSRYWRLRPVAFNGGAQDYWEVHRLEMHEYEETQLSNLQLDGGILENRDRDYAETSIQLKMYFEISESQTEMTKFGFELDTHQMTLTTSFKQTIQIIGRPIVIGDILEIPPESQYTPTLERVRKYVEVIDVFWSADGYTPGWQPTLQKVIAVPMAASQETMDITKEKSKGLDAIGFIDTPNSFVDLTNITDRVKAEANKLSPQRGRDTHNLRTFDEEEVSKAAEIGINLAQLNQPNRSLYVEDALPPNHEPYTEGDAWPSSPTDGDWHRLTYTSSDSTIPARLFRYNGVKQRWMYYETDRRAQYSATIPSIQGALKSNDRISSTEVGKD